MLGLIFLNLFQLLIKLRTTLDAKDTADKSSILYNLRYESSGYNSVVPHFLGLLKSEVFERLTKEIKDFFLEEQAETIAVKADPSKRGATLRALVKEREEAAAAVAATAVQRQDSIDKRTVSADALGPVIVGATRKRTIIQQDPEEEEEEKEEEEEEEEERIVRKTVSERGEKSKKKKQKKQEKAEVQKTRRQKNPSTLDLFSPVSSSAEDTE